MSEYSKPLAAMVVAAFLALSFWGWPVAQPHGDIASWVFLPLVVVAFIGSYRLVLDPWRATRSIIVRPDATLARFVTGHLWAAICATVFVAVTMSVLAWHLLDSPKGATSILFFTSLLAVLGFVMLDRFLDMTLHPPFSRKLATEIAALLFGLILFWLMREIILTEPHSEEILSSTILDAAHIGLSRYTDMPGFVAQLLSIASAIDAVKLWLVAELRDVPYLVDLFVLQQALFAFLMTRFAVVSLQGTLALMGALR